MSAAINQERLRVIGVACICGCGQKAPLAKRTNARLGHVKGRPLRYVSGHNRRGSTNLARYRVLANGCWDWLGSRTRKGYGRAQVNGRHKGAHRALWEEIYGQLPANVQLDHLCRNRACVNPAHLEPVTNAENSRRSANTKLSADAVIAIRASADSQRITALRFGVSRQTVSDIRSLRRWVANPSALQPVERMIDARDMS